MPNSGNDLGRTLPEWFRLSDPEINGTDFNKLILLIFRRLDAEYPERVDLSDCNKLRERVNEFNRIWEWLEDQRMVSGPVSNCSLTLSGRQAFQKAVQLASASTRMMLQSKEGLSGNEAKELMMSILRQHYLDYIARTEKR
ncbi:MAG: hypothetical protein HKN11_18275 [Rhizobiales bacterium]|nr:hypothetical protein [Hyphomicrobiales bacterium]